LAPLPRFLFAFAGSFSPQPHRLFDVVFAFLPLLFAVFQDRPSSALFAFFFFLYECLSIRLSYPPLPFFYPFGFFFFFNPLSGGWAALLPLFLMTPFSDGVENSVGFLLSEFVFLFRFSFPLPSTSLARSFLPEEARKVWTESFLPSYPSQFSFFFFDIL